MSGAQRAAAGRQGKLRIRTARPEDLAQIVALERLCFPPEEAAAEEALRARLAVYPGHFWLLEERGVLVSFLNGFATDREHLEDEMFADASLHCETGRWQMIFGLDTHPARRGCGCAGLLLRHVIGEARRQGRRGLVLTCKPQLVHYYAGFGFADEGVSASQHGGAVWHEMRLTF